MKKPKMFWDDLDKQREMFAPSVPAGIGFTTKEYSERYKLSRNRAAAQLQSLLNSSKIEVIGIRKGLSGWTKVYNIKK